jgi:hypothetical protein
MAATLDEPAAARLECLRTAMRGLEGQIVSVRVVSDSKNLVVVFRGTLCPPSDDKHPTLFWPVDEEPSTADHAAREKPGIYLHPDLLEDVIVHTGEFVVEFRQAAVTVNVRRGIVETGILRRASRPAQVVARLSIIVCQAHIW